ncbi:SNF1-interacting protein [Linnemannia schmuckeri]|uniref:SNF1-interacting protein n=1 Tax=Linnemannia schmuckeri TaxID=64567 RepID=A0A9P5RZ41_9FUNG|nr:SNF1-interacting protein [Linnemannia schmuckeri]
MGNTTTKEKTDHVDGGTLLPNGIYSGPQDYDFRIVQRLIHQRRLAPFYKGLEDWDDNEDALEVRAAAAAASGGSSASASTHQQQQQQSARGAHAHSHSHSTSSHGHTRGNSSSHNNSQGYAERSMVADPEREMKRLYQGAIECPICFLYYPRNINRTRCCDKPMCTECFVQLKRLESAPTESPACPYCVEPHFGVIYSPALLPSGLPGSPIPGHMTATTMTGSPSSSSLDRGVDAQSPSSPSTRRRSTSHKSPEVVAADDLRPDWNRRILAAAQRQPGSRRASTSSSVSNSTFALGRRLAVGRQGTSSRRSNSTAAAQDYNGYLSAMRHMGTDLEELMIMEAMRQSLQDEEERLAREAAAAAAGGGGSNPTAGQTGEGNATGSSSPSSSTQQNHGHSGQGARGTARMGGSTASPATGHSRSSTQSNTVHGGSTPVPALALSRSDNGSLESLSDDRGVRHADDDSDSDQEDSPALLDNRAIRYAQVNLGTGRTATSGAANGSGSVREGSDLPKHHRQTEGPGSRNAPEAV